MSAEQYTRYASRSVWPPPEPASFTIRFASLDDIPGLTTLFDAYRMFYGRASAHRAAGEFLAARFSAGESIVLVRFASVPRRSSDSRSSSADFLRCRSAA